MVLVNKNNFFLTHLFTPGLEDITKAKFNMTLEDFNQAINQVLEDFRQKKEEEEKKELKKQKGKKEIMKKGEKKEKMKEPEALICELKWN